VTDIVAFIRARLDEDERIARAATAGPWEVNSADYPESESICAPDGTAVVAAFDSHHEAFHIARHDPARVLREVAARRRTLGRHEAHEGRCVVCCTGDDDGWHVAPCGTVCDLADAWSDHPDHDQAWTVE
jgi:hypothetical protein